MKRLITELAAQTAMVLVIAVAVGVTALITIVPIGGAALGVAPEPHFRLVGSLICPAGSQVDFEEGGTVVTYSDGQPTTGNEILVYCVDDQEGTRRQLGAEESLFGLLGATTVVLTGYFLLCFVPIFLPAVITGAVLTHKIVRSLTNPAGRTISI